MRIAAVAVLTLVLALPAPAAPAPKRAAIQLESTAPLVVRGKHFGTREPVLLTYTAADLTRRVVGVRAKRDGSFRATFPLSLDRCAAFTVRAAGLRGTRAVLQVEPACEEKRKGPPKRAPAVPPKPPQD
jgi:hypothetical protein